jgi:hypothetical protein
MREFVKRSALILGIALSGIQVMAQIEPKDFTINGKVKNGSKGEKVILSQSTAAGSSVKLDSALLAADGSFSLKSVEKDRGSFFTLNIADRQKFPLLVEGGETFNVTADGTQRDDKGNGGKVSITGSKNMEYYAKVDQLMQAFSAKVTGWNEEYAKAEEKKDAKKIQEIQQAYQAAEKERVTALRQMIPEMGTSLIALFAANNFLTPESDLDVLKKLADDFSKVEPTPTLAKGFIGSVKRMAGVAVGEQAPDFTLNSPESHCRHYAANMF